MVHPVTTNIFCLNAFNPSKPGTGLYNIKGPGQLILGTIIKYKKVFRLQLGKYVQVHHPVT